MRLAARQGQGVERELRARAIATLGVDFPIDNQWRSVGIERDEIRNRLDLYTRAFELQRAVRNAPGS
jgi:hypothetical protein